ncbi:OsmC family protein [Beutenbergia cavernae DSM 12333]|uniref:OsmC family protein n=1 Tax=Beutenbergia cavernae (strain ATCC BAA-8 / DSM 12333 / CCUG 43141 / JCM 11478 / NBRC 16432 / NCIMB 13614 / HKI 0122) TaxID=471853 RepID=C5BV42_BEUC1|nr:OsmC family protein [Beutenbergia cavernae]ACQ80429.1 OsmC family protein [Beutenbergia cavernae DSM 12333]
MGGLHSYTVSVDWTGAREGGTIGYRAYSREHEVLITGKPPLPGSADPAFRGDPERYTPEELLVAALAQCHMLWFLHLASTSGVVVTSYSDRALGTMRVETGGAGQFVEVVLHPRVELARRDASDGAEPVDDAALAVLHERAHDHCFIARSVNFPVLLDPAPLGAGAPA